MLRGPRSLNWFAALICFGLGIGVAVVFGWTTRAPGSNADASLSVATLDAGAEGGPMLFGDAGPKILFDPNSISLLPDASLRLSPSVLDAGTP